MKKLSLLPLFLVGLLCGGKAQSSASVSAPPASDFSSFSKQDEMKILTSNKMRNVTSFDNRYEGVKGSPFFFENWVEGRLILSDSSLVKNRFQYRFDAMNNQVWVKTISGDQRIVYSREVNSFELKGSDGQHVKFRRVKLPEIMDKHHFAIAIYDGAHFSLVRDCKKVFHKADLEDKGLVTVGHAYDWFEEINNFYLKKLDGEYQLVVLKRGDLIESMKLSKPNTELVEKFCKTNGLKGKLKEEEAIKIINYADSLLQM